MMPKVFNNKVIALLLTWHNESFWSNWTNIQNIFFRSIRSYVLLLVFSCTMYFSLIINYKTSLKPYSIELYQLVEVVVLEKFVIFVILALWSRFSWYFHKVLKIPREKQLACKLYTKNWKNKYIQQRRQFK